MGLSERSIFPAVAAVTLAVAVPFAGAGPDDARLSDEVAFQEAYYLEAAQRDFEGAIKAYQKLLDRPQLKPSVKAKALYHAGRCLEALHRREEAWDIYQRLKIELQAEDIWVSRARSRQLRLSPADPAVLMPDDVRVYLEISQPANQLENLGRIIPLEPAEQTAESRFILAALRDTTCHFAGVGFTDLSAGPQRHDVLAIRFGSDTRLDRELERQCQGRFKRLTQEPGLELKLYEVKTESQGLRWWALGPGVAISSNDRKLFDRTWHRFLQTRPDKTGSSAKAGPTKAATPVPRTASRPAETGKSEQRSGVAAFRRLVLLTRDEPGLSIYFHVPPILGDYRGKQPPRELQALQSLFDLRTLQDVLVRARIDTDRLAVDVTLGELPEARTPNRALAVWRTNRLDQEILNYVPSDVLFSVCLSCDDAAAKLGQILKAAEFLRNSHPLIWSAIASHPSIRELQRLRADWPEELGIDPAVFGRGLSFAVMRVPVGQDDEMAAWGLLPGPEVAGLAVVIKAKAPTADLSTLRFYFERLLRHLIQVHDPEAQVESRFPFRESDNVTLRVLSAEGVPLKPAIAQTQSGNVLVVGMSAAAVEHILDSKLANKTLREDRLAAVNIDEAKAAQPAKVVTLAPRLLTSYDQLDMFWSEQTAGRVRDLLDKAAAITFFTVEETGQNQVQFSLRLDLKVLEAAYRLLNDRREASPPSPASLPSRATRPATRAASRPYSAGEAQ